MDALTIGQLAAESGSNVQTIRYYEAIGLLPKAARSDGNQRRYRRDHLDRLRFIRHSRELGFQIETIRELLKLSDQKQRDCDAVDAIASQQLVEVQSKIRRLRTLERVLKDLIGQCHKGKVVDCTIIAALSGPTTRPQAAMRT